MLERGEIHLGISLLETVEADERQFGIYQVPPLELLAAFRPSFPLERHRLVDIGRIAVHPLLVLDSGFVMRRTFDAICRVAGLRPNILIESRAPHTLLALAEAGLGLAIIPSPTRTQRYALRTTRITYKGKPIQEPLAVVWDKRRVLPQYAQGFCELLATHMRALFSTGQPSIGSRRLRASS